MASQSDTWRGLPKTVDTASNAAAESRHQATQKPVKCTYAWCIQRFATEKEMRFHKKNDPKHFYCKKCDVDCEDWAGLTKHKVFRMAPFIEGDAVADENNMPEHIVCEFCGEDFKSFGGRKRHRKLMHPAEQTLVCAGCTKIHHTAAELVHHLEAGECNGISWQDFFRSMQRKYINEQIMEAPDMLRKALDAKSRQERAKITDGSEVDGQDGGVPLLDRHDAQSVTSESLKPSSRGRITYAHARPEGQDWPELPVRATSQLHKSLQGLSIDDKTQARSRRDSQHTTTDQSLTWVGNNSKSLFPTSTPLAGDWNAIQRVREREAQLSGQNILKVCWWDPLSEEYNPAFFHDQHLGRFVCPMPKCVEDGTSFPTLNDFKEHFELEHLRSVLSCIACLKRFNSCAALISHAESTLTCGIRESKYFKKFIDDISGGYVKAKFVNERKIYHPESALVKSGEPMGGVMSVKYSAAKPE